VPNAQVVQHGNVAGTLVPHSSAIARLLKNRHIECPAPIVKYYDWCNSDPFPSQIATAEMLTTNRRAYVLSEIGAGKSRAALYAADWLIREGEVTRVLVIAPLSTLTMTWDREIFESFPHLRSVVLHADRVKRRRLLQEEADVYIINHDGVKILLRELIDRKDINLVIIDELAVGRNPSTQLHKVLRELASQKPWVWGMTGSPTPNAPTDAWGQARILTPERVPRSFRAFRDKTMRQITPFKWIERPEATAIVAEALQPAVRFTRPPLTITYSDRETPLSTEAAKAYKSMLKDLVMQTQDGIQVKALNEAVQLTKLLQISAGFVYDETGAARYVGGARRVFEVKSIIEGAEGKVIVYAPFTFLAKLFAAAIERWYPTGLVFGETSKTKRDEIFNGFQFGDLRVLVAHPRTMSHGLTLTAANVIVWAAPPMSPEVYEQANGRITRAGQTRNPHIIHLVGSKTEYEVYKRLRKKMALQGALLKIIEAQTTGGG
jgi:SNF2 family DNA or RNA helicase